MAELTHLKKGVVGAQTSVSATKEEATNLTVSWSDLTTAGFANGDEVLLIMRVNVSNDTQYIESYFDLRIGNTFGGASPQREYTLEMRRNFHTHEEGYLGKYTLSTNDNIYIGFSTETATTTTTQLTDYQLLVLSVDEMGTDIIWGEDNTADTSVGTTYEDGVSINLPTNGDADDYLVIGSVHYTNDQTFSDSTLGYRLNLDSTVRVPCERTSMTVNGERTNLMISGVAGAADNAVCKVQYGAYKASSSDIVQTRICAINLNNLFVDHVIDVATGNTANLNPGVVTVNADLTMTAGGEAAAFAQTIAESSSLFYDAIHELRYDTSNEFLANFGDSVNADPSAGNADTPAIPLSAFYITTLTSGTKTLEHYVDGDQNDMGSAGQSMIGFSLELVSSTPTIDTLTETVQSPTHITGTFNTDTNAGTQYAWATTNASETAANIVANGTSKAVTAAGSQSYSVTATPGSSVYVHVVHQNSGNNSNVLSSSQKTMESAYTESALYDESPITSEDQLPWIADGTHTGANNAAVLTDATQSFTVDALIGAEVNNTSDGSPGSFATITENDATTVTGTLSGGTDNDWDTNDAYVIYTPLTTADTMTCEATITVASEAADLKYYFYDDSASEYTETATLSLVLTGYADGVYDVTLATDGSFTLTAQAEAGDGSGMVKAVVRDIVRGITKNIVR